VSDDCTRGSHLINAVEGEFVYMGHTCIPFLCHSRHPHLSSY